MELNELARQIFHWAETKGWNEEIILSEKLLLCHSELSEAWEEIRNNHKPEEIYHSITGFCKCGHKEFLHKIDNTCYVSTCLCKKYIPILKPEGFPIELADAIIRILHICQCYGIRIEEAINEKMIYNAIRPYRHGGKAC